MSIAPRKSGRGIISVRWEPGGPAFQQPGTASQTSQTRRIKKADPGKVGFEWSWWKVLWVVGERTFHIGGRMDRLPKRARRLWFLKSVPRGLSPLRTLSRKAADVPNAAAAARIIPCGPLPLGPKGFAINDFADPTFPLARTQQEIRRHRVAFVVVPPTNRRRRSILAAATPPLIILLPLRRQRAKSRTGHKLSISPETSPCAFL